MKKHILLFLTFIAALASVPTMAQTGIEVNPYSIQFDGSNDYVAVPNDASLNPDSTISIETWVKLNSTFQYNCLVEKVSRVPNKGYSLEVFYNNLWFTIYTPGSFKQIVVPFSSTNSWNHVAVVYDGLYMIVYINGRQSKKSFVGSDVIVHTSDSLYMGKDHTSTNTLLKGNMDDTKIWSIALDADQIYSRMYRSIDEAEIASDPLYTGLVAYWKFDNAGGSIMDSSLYGNHGDEHGVIRDSDCPAISYGKNGLYFDGVNDYVNVGSSGSLELYNSFTLEAWIKPESFGDYEPIIDRWLQASTVYNFKQGYSLSVMADQRLNLRLVFSTNDSFEISSNSLIDTSKWFHVAATYDGDTVKLFIDGQLDNYVTISDNIVYTISQDLHLGAENGFTMQKYFNGSIGEARIWSVELPKNDLIKRAFSRIDEEDEYWDNLLLNWTLNEGKGNRTYDHSSYEHTGTLVNGPQWIKIESFFQEIHWLGYDIFWNNPFNWDLAVVPTAFHNVIIDSKAIDPYVVLGNAVCRNLKIVPDANLTIAHTKRLDVYGNVLIETDFVHTGSVIDYGVLNVQGYGHFKRYVTHSGWHYISSPVDHATVEGFMDKDQGIYPGLWYYDETVYNPNKRWIPITSAYDTLKVMKGYDVYYKNNPITVDFYGVFNKGRFSMNLTAKTDSYNFVGNPYPSTIDWDAPQGWTRVNVDNGIYIWDPHTHAVTTYVNGVGTNGGSRYIAPTQTFFIICNDTNGGLIGVEDKVRSAAGVPFREDEVDDHIRFKLKAEGYTDEVVLRFNSEASTMFDSDYDAYKFFSFNTDVSSLYFKSEEGKLLSISSLSQLRDNLSVPLYCKPAALGREMTIEPDLTNIPQDVDVYLEDLKTGITKNLKEGSYSFVANERSSDGRFIVHFVNAQNFSSTEDIDAENSLTVWSNEKTIYLQLNEDVVNSTIQIFDVFGRMLYSSETEIYGTHEISLNSLASGYYVVKVNTEKNTLAKKVFIK
jgi:hypothetical protein